MEIILFLLRLLRLVAVMEMLTTAPRQTPVRLGVVVVVVHILHHLVVLALLVRAMQEELAQLVLVSKVQAVAGQAVLVKAEALALALVV
jgi:hypothetical protein